MMKDDDLEEFLLLEDLIFPEKESDDEDDDNDEDADKADDDDDNDVEDVSDDDVVEDVSDAEDLAFTFGAPDRQEPDSEPRPRSAPQVNGRNNLSPAATRFIAGLVTAGIAFFLVLLFILICVLWK